MPKKTADKTHQSTGISSLTLSSSRIRCLRATAILQRNQWSSPQAKAAVALRITAAPHSGLLLTPEQFEQKLQGRRVKRLSARTRAAVAVLVRFGEERPEVLLMRRAERAGDRWSGHVSFPGGKEERGDVSLQATAERETREELGIDLAQCARYLGPLDPVRAMARGRVIPTVIAPHVYMQTGSVEVCLSEEATRSFWLPLDAALAGRLDDEFPYEIGPTQIKLSCWRYDGEVIWGLTFQMLKSLLDLVAEKR